MYVIVEILIWITYILSFIFVRFLNDEYIVDSITI